MGKDNVSLCAIWVAIIAIAWYSYDSRNWNYVIKQDPAIKTQLQPPMQLSPTCGLSMKPNTELAPKLRILSYDPFIVHIENFLTDYERKYLINYSKPLLSRSTVLHQDGSQSESLERTSSTAYLPQNDMIVASVLERASEFQGYIPITSLDMQVTSYQQGQEYRPHYDWFLQENLIVNRLSSFFAILETDCEDCGTQFPNVKVNWTEKDLKLCRFVDCKNPIFTTKNIVGSAIYWRNLDENRRGRYDTMHAGLPLPSGTKIGLNIWTNIKGSSSPYDGRRKSQIYHGQSQGHRATINAGNDRNFYLAGAAGAPSKFESDNGTIVSDTEGRYFYFYQDVMSELGAPRMRLSTLDAVSETAEMVVFQHIDAATLEQLGNPKEAQAQSNYVVVDTSGNIYYTTMCSIENQSPQFFLEAAKHPSSELKKQSLVWTVTGGEVMVCGDFPLDQVTSRGTRISTEVSMDITQSKSFWT